MGSINFLKYMSRFEDEVICEGVKRGIIGKQMLVNVREGKFSCTKFARYMGNHLNFSTPFVLDYYGYLKRSEGFADLVREKKNQIKDRQIKCVQAKVVFFAALKIEEIAEITSDQYLRSGFSEFKKIILHWRGFEKRKGKAEVMEE